MLVNTFDTDPINVGISMITSLDSWDLIPLIVREVGGPDWNP